MARRFPTFVVLMPMLAACATTAPGPVVEPSMVDEAVYLEGVTTRYSVRLDELRESARSDRNCRLPNAVVAGDQTMTVAASLFRCDDVYTLDLVIQNLSDEAIEFDRARLELFDNLGDRLNPMYEWEEGRNFGLRAEQSTFRGYKHMGTDFQGGQAGSKAEKAHTGTEQKMVAHSVPAGSRVGMEGNERTPLDFTWLAELEMEETVTLPDVLSIEGHRNVPYWAYWRGKSVNLPLTAILVIDGKRMLMRFDASDGTAR